MMPFADFPRPGTKEWGEMNVRRAELIHCEVHGSLKPEEAEELRYLQEASLWWVDKVYPRSPTGFVDRNILLATVTGCARCGENHESLSFTPLSNASDNYKWWGTCPVKDEPILLREIVT